jgi:hypothetical protein
LYTIAHPADHALSGQFVGDYIIVGIAAAMRPTRRRSGARAPSGGRRFVNAMGSGCGYRNSGSGYAGNAGQNIYNRRESIEAVSSDVILFAAGVDDTPGNNNAGCTGADVEAQVTALLRT